VWLLWYQSLTLCCPQLLHIGHVELDTGDTVIVREGWMEAMVVEGCDMTLGETFSNW
jgi:hypothetical protein